MTGSLPCQRKRTSHLEAKFVPSISVKQDSPRPCQITRGRGFENDKISCVGLARAATAEARQNTVWYNMAGQSCCTACCVQLQRAAGKELRNQPSAILPRLTFLFEITALFRSSITVCHLGLLGQSNSEETRPRGNAQVRKKLNSPPR